MTMPQPTSKTAAPLETLAGTVERVTYHNAENGFAVLKVQTRGKRDLVTVIGHVGSTATAFATSLGACVPQQPVGASVGSAAVLANAPPPEPEVGEQAVVASDERQVMSRAAYGPVRGE